MDSHRGDETETPAPSSLGLAPDPSAAIRPWGIRFLGIAESDSAGDRIGFALRSTSLVRQVSRNDETARDMAERDGRRRQRALPAWRTVGCQTAAHQRNGCGSSRSTPTARCTATRAWRACGAVRKTLEICARAISSVGRAPRLHRGCVPASLRNSLPQDTEKHDLFIRFGKRFRLRNRYVNRFLVRQCGRDPFSARLASVR